jgi:hypothetical protein
MTRASVAVAFVLLVVGCREEPTIVIKFEPNDLGKSAVAAKVADMAEAAKPPADMTVVAEKAPPGKKKGAAAECKAAADCVVAPLECCDCANGGKQHAIAKKTAAAAKSAHDARCKAQMCTMMLSTDPSCGMKADCVDGACVMVKREK